MNISSLLANLELGSMGGGRGGGEWELLMVDLNTENIDLLLFMFCRSSTECSVTQCQSTERMVSSFHFQ